MSESATLGPVFLDLAGLELTDEEAGLLQNPCTGGVILFSRNYESLAQLRRLVSAIRNARPSILIAVDQEGGRVQRFRREFTRLPPLQRIGELSTVDSVRAEDLAYRCGWLMASELRALDIDLSFAPVLDADDNFSDVIGDRSFGRDVERIVRLGSQYIRGMHDAGMPATAKHFPGHGAIKADSHVADAVDQRPWEQIETTDLVPFTRLLPSCEAVMPAHVIFPQVDPFPVGFSQRWLQQILRTRLGFDGVIFSDDLSMQGAAGAGSYSQRAAAALSAGCDAVLVCNQPAGAREVLAFLEEQVWPDSRRLSLLRDKLRKPFVDPEALRRDEYWLECHEAIKQVPVG